MRVLRNLDGPTPDDVVAEHVALPEQRSGTDRRVRAPEHDLVGRRRQRVAGMSGGLGNQDDHAVFKALRERADIVLVGLGTVFAEHYHVPESPDLRIYVIADHVDISGDEELFEGGRTTLILPEDAEPAPAGVPDLRAGSKGVIDLKAVVASSRDRSSSSRAVRAWPAPWSRSASSTSSSSPSRRASSPATRRVVHGPDADPEPWDLEHGFVDNEGFIFLRYGRAR